MWNACYLWLTYFHFIITYHRVQVVHESWKTVEVHFKRGRRLIWLFFFLTIILNNILNRFCKHNTSLFLAVKHWPGTHVGYDPAVFKMWSLGFTVRVACNGWKPWRCTCGRPLRAGPGSGPDHFPLTRARLPVLSRMKKKCNLMNS